MGDLVPTFCTFYFTTALVVDLRSQNPLHDYAIDERPLHRASLGRRNPRRRRSKQKRIGRGYLVVFSVARFGA